MTYAYKTSSRVYTILSSYWTVYFMYWVICKMETLDILLHIVIPMIYSLVNFYVLRFLSISFSELVHMDCTNMMETMTSKCIEYTKENFDAVLNTNKITINILNATASSICYIIYLITALSKTSNIIAVLIIEIIVFILLALSIFKKYKRCKLYRLYVEVKFDKVYCHYKK